jgi:hypothetical protein
MPFSFFQMCSRQARETRQGFSSHRGGLFFSGTRLAKYLSIELPGYAISIATRRGMG